MEAAGYRLTAPRRLVAEVIAAQTSAFRASSLLTHPRLHSSGVGRATVFRTLELLVELGVVERLELASGEKAYVPCEPVHHHHVVCERCGRTREVTDGGMPAVALEVERQTGYRITSHRLALFGLCPACRSQAGAS
jgi:Fur family ferric uptake transcriptional regulator